MGPNDISDIKKRLLMIEQYMKEGKEQRGQINNTMTTLNLRCTNIENSIYGDPKQSDNKPLRDGAIRRLEELEDEKHAVKEMRNNLLKVAVGAMAMSIGSFILWLFKVIWGAK